MRHLYAVPTDPSSRVRIEFSCSETRPTLARKPDAAVRAIGDLLTQYTPRDRAMILLVCCDLEASRQEWGV